MSLTQQAYETYSFAEKNFCGVYIAGAKEPLAPVAHTITKASIEITIDKNGKFLQANAVDKTDEKTIFPVTEESAGRTSNAAEQPHPLCEQLQYLYPGKKYLEQLAQWEASPYSHPILTAVLKYVEQGSIVEDLSVAGLIKKDADGNIKNGKDFVRWIVSGIGTEEGECWRNRRLQDSFVNWYALQQSEKTDYCMISGQIAVPAKQHAKGIVALNGNAKLISANDTSGFTYRGRFQNDAEALCVGYITSQKIHNALRWVIANQGLYFGGRCFVCWNSRGKRLPHPMGIMARQKGKTEEVYTPTAYREQLKNTLNSWKNEFPSDANAVTAVFDAATSGRLSLTYYSELQAADFIDRLGFWEETCCWLNGDFGIQSPSLFNITLYAFGTLRESGFEADDNITKQVMLQLLSCRMEKSVFPVSVRNSIVQKANNFQIIPDDKEHKYLRRALLFTCCAVIRKYRYDRFKEEWTMALEPDKKDRSYQFGRLMAIMEKIEKDTYCSDDTRETNIIRRQQAFVARPYSVAASVLSHLKIAYYPQLPVAARIKYERQIEEIMEILSESNYSDLNKPLSDTYLLGYYLQKKELYTAKKENVEE